jgi:hypothetical protein
MRTKALLCAAALAAGALTSMAQSNVYSLNVVGYYNASVVGSGSGTFTMVANQLNTTNNTVGALIATPPDFTTLYKYVGTGFSIATYFLGAWDHPEFTLNPGEGAIIQSTSPFTNTFVGEVLQGNLTNSFPAGFSIRSSMVPQAGTLTQLGLPGTALSDFDQVYKMNTATQGYDIYAWFLGSWSPSEPSLAVGESMWLQTAAPGNWVRNFTVQ